MPGLNVIDIILGGGGRGAAWPWWGVALTLGILCLIIGMAAFAIWHDHHL